MPCASSDNRSAAGVEITDLLELHKFTPGVQFTPRTKGELVAAVATSFGGPRSLRALGGKYSLSDAWRADNVIDTSDLNLHLSKPYLPGRNEIPAARLRDGGTDFLAYACLHDPGLAGRHFVHVEAGIKVYTLLEDLGGCGLVLPTMGATGGQSLAGSLSTGTHGADFEVPPLVEWIRAIHLVGPRGQE